MNTPAIIEPIKQFGYRVNIHRYCTHSKHSDEPYGEWSASYSNSFRSISKDDKYPDVTSARDFVVGESAYLVWAEWSSGDSFGTSNYCSVEAFGLFKDKGEADAFRLVLENASEADGKWLPWFGYFESLNCVHVEHVTIGE